jgi:hypothetical protein
MNSTNELRFLEREVSVPVPGYDDVVRTTTIQILQQKWIYEESYEEWRDVPVVKETE